MVNAVILTVILVAVAVVMAAALAGFGPYLFGEQKPTAEPAVKSATTFDNSPRYILNQTDGSLLQRWHISGNGTSRYEYQPYGNMVTVNDYGNLTTIKYYTSQFQSGRPDHWQNIAYQKASDYIGKGFKLTEEKKLYETELDGVYPTGFAVYEITLQKIIARTS